ncbi:MAG TPA: RcnB family protein [Patescibacteria group bacterium]|nr:RcnB family protein [Patescibacteria group bacterium]
MRKVLSTFIALFALTIAAPAFAGHGNGHGNGNGHGDDHFSGDNDRHSQGASIVYHDRLIIEDYLSQHEHRKHCPPGLAKKHNGCLPPGQAKKYQVGERLPTGVTWSPVPHDLLVMLTPPPRGYRYVRVDHDVLLIGEATKKVIDAVELLSAVGH